ncbi:calpain-8-like isoform X1 [Phyllobates terribilis]|uniref:calpain-8-like isoform X1 n=1 Tax=Phyllobates terribilis TaxID=111132 RepID=UPI003CCB6CF2
MSGVASKIAQDRAKAEGLGSPENPIKFADQDFEKLRAECLASNKLFEDEKFKAEQSSLGKDMEELGPDTEKAQGMEWKRPTEIMKNPKFIVGGFENEDVMQGGLGNCWFLGSITCLTTNIDCLSYIVPSDQSFDKDYAGIFHFKFWQYGEWVEVVIDDKLPTKNNKLFFATSQTSDEFWSALLEKAYAKINGSYEGLRSGYILDSMEDFTGGVAEIFPISSVPNDFFQKMQRALEYKCLAACDSPPKGTQDISTMSSSIAKGHMYTITRAKEVTYGNNKAQLIRMRNPWGYNEWQGAWSDKSEIWNQVDAKIKAELNTDKDEGEFWIAFPDFLTEYYKVTICDVTMSELFGGDHYNWCLTEFNGEWKNGSTAGGNSSYDTFWINPQYRITLQAPDGDASEKCSIVVSVIQKDRRKIKIRARAYIKIGFYIYKLSRTDELPLGKEFFLNNRSVASEANYDNKYREAVQRLELFPGDYVIVPAAKTPEEEAQFYLRVFTKKPTGGQEPGRSTLTDIFQPKITPETDSAFDIVKDELQKGEFNENEVKDMLNKMSAKYPELKSAGFTIKSVQDLIKLMDVDSSKTLSVDEFKKTWLKVDNYWRIFQAADADKSATLSDTEFRNAMKQAGFNFNISILNAIVHKVGPDSLKLDFNVFLSITANLETSFKMFTLMNPKQGASINLSLDEWLLTRLA